MKKMCSESSFSRCDSVWVSCRFTWCVGLPGECCVDGMQWILLQSLWFCVLQVPQWLPVQARAFRQDLHLRFWGLWVVSLCSVLAWYLCVCVCVCVLDICVCVCVCVDGWMCPCKNECVSVHSYGLCLMHARLCVRADLFCVCALCGRCG